MERKETVAKMTSKTHWVRIVSASLMGTIRLLDKKGEVLAEFLDLSALFQLPYGVPVRRVSAFYFPVTQWPAFGPSLSRNRDVWSFEEEGS